MPIPPSWDGADHRTQHPAEPLGEQRDDRQERLPHRAHGRASRAAASPRTPMRAQARRNRRRRPGLRRPLPDRQERQACWSESSRVGDGGPIHGGSSLPHPATWTSARSSSDRRSTSSFDDVARGNSDALPHDRVRRCRGEDGRTCKRIDVVGRPFVPGRTSELTAAARDLRHPVRGAGQADRAAPAGDAAEYRHLRGARLDAALLVAAKTCDMLGLAAARIHGLTMPGFGTTHRTRTNALDLMDHLGVVGDDRHLGLALQTFHELRHAAVRHRPPGARRRRRSPPRSGGCRARGVTTWLRERPGPAADIPADVARLRGRHRRPLRLAMGWSTYNGDHMSNYNPNARSPKRSSSSWSIRRANEFEAGPVRDTLLSIVDTTISPELLPLPPAARSSSPPRTTLGPYEILDFFLFNTVRNGFSPGRSSS